MHWREKKIMSLSFVCVQICLLYAICIIALSSAVSANPTLANFLKCLSVHALPSTNLTELVTLQGNPDYSLLLKSSIQNLRFTSPATSKPQLIVSPTNALQVQASVICCRKHGLLIRVRSGGHDYEGLSYRSTSDGLFILVDLANLRSVHVDIGDNVASVEAGATVGEVYYKIAQKSALHGFPAGTCPTIGAGGHISGGGIGMMLRKYGLAADNILDAVIVDANGRLLDRAAMGEDLFWAIRGGGGASFGIIVSWKIGLVPVTKTVAAFTVRRTVEQGAAELLNKWQRVAYELHDDLHLKVDLNPTTSGPVAEFKCFFLGGCERLLRQMDGSFPELGVKQSDCQEMSWIESTVYFAGYTNGEPLETLTNRSLQPKIYNKGKSDYVKVPIPVNGWEGILERLSHQGAGSIWMDPYGGRMNEIPETEIAYPHRSGYLFIVQYLARWRSGSAAESMKHLSWMKGMHGYMTPYVSSNPRAQYLNFRDLDIGKNEEGESNYTSAKVWGEKYFKSNFKRLAIVKGEVDPENFFSNEQSIPPLRCS